MDEEAEDLLAEQQRLAAEEADRARRAEEPEEFAAHERRSEKAEYLRQKLDERRRSDS